MGQRIGYSGVGSGEGLEFAYQYSRDISPYEEGVVTHGGERGPQTPLPDLTSK